MMIAGQEMAQKTRCMEHQYIILQRQKALSYGSVARSGGEKKNPRNPIFDMQKRAALS
jgi:hypothetical protein